MNFASQEIILESQRGRQWSQFVTQQVRLRHINQIWCLNLKTENIKTGKYYFTIHSTSMSSPFFTSDLTHGPHPKWQDLIFNKFPSLSAIVLRVWKQQSENNDTILLTWGINLSGLVFIGNKVTDIQPSLFKENTLVFFMAGGFFTFNLNIRDDIKKLPNSIRQSMNMVNFPIDKSIFKRTFALYPKNETKNSYSAEKLRKLHYLEVMIKNKKLDVQEIQNEILANDVLLQKPEQQQLDNIKLAPSKTTQLLTMDYLNRMLDEKPTRIQKYKMFKINQKIEQVKFRKKLLSQERERQLSKVRRMRAKYTSLVEKISERETSLMECYHNLHKEREKLKEYQSNVSQHRELLVHTNNQLQHRKRQLLQQLLGIYPIKLCGNADSEFSINGMYLPVSDLLSDINDDRISVALGYVAHVLTMCSIFLQVPLRYPVAHYGSRSTITDQIANNIPEREFPLFTKGKDKMQFTYAVYLLNKNIAQLRWLNFMHTSDLKLTLSNLLNFLQGYRESKQDRFTFVKSGSNCSLEEHKQRPLLANLQRLPSGNCLNHCYDPILDFLRHEKRQLNSRSSSPSGNFASTSINGNKKVKEKKLYENAGLSEILAIPEAFLSRNMSNDSFRNYLSVSSGEGRREVDNICDNNKKHNESVEEGTDLLNPKMKLNDVVVDTTQETRDSMKNDVFTCKYVGSSSEETASKSGDFMEKWLKTGPALVCSDKNLYPDEYLGSTSAPSTSGESRLTARTDALLTTKSFNLVKPKH